MKLSVDVSAVAAFAVASAAVVPKSNLFAVTRRQTSNACSFYCDPLSSIADACGKDVSCLCSALTASVMYTCATCDLKDGYATYSDLQNTLNSYSSECAQSGSPVGTLPLSTC
ncbi:hypothetical protein M407DRAFT_28130 [Tulasnella calospora MUT 4182]|uniref:Extracellular membrane protein CFEM domain-containing protein n=1 Tax=Tulasnella calospora MUT 4182 TaxID=1051891 RepID=A0A0C3Q1Z7_9AGAM|nr:hypothetical protein M407DRAFT_28130 [Tulasnella calospora MUT 4182]